MLDGGTKWAWLKGVVWLFVVTSQSYRKSWQLILVLWTQDVCIYLWIINTEPRADIILSNMEIYIY